MRETLTGELSAHQISGIVAEMDSDDAADFIGDMPEKEAEKVIEILPAEDRAEVRSLLQYPEESAGGLMQVELVSLKSSQTCADAVKLIRSKAEEVEDFHYVFVTSDDGKLTGTVPLAQLILHSKETVIEEIMEKDPVVIEVTAGEEEVAQKFRKYDLFSLAVVDDDGKLLGRILHDDILDVITETSTEDILKVAGTADEEFESGSWLNAARHRLPWLLSSLAGGVFMASIITQMGAPLEKVIALAAFIPVITGMSGNVSTQSSAIVVRGITLGKIEGKLVLEYMTKEFWVGLAMATFCGILMGFIAWSLKQNPGIGIIVGLSLFIAMGCAAMIGTFVPIILQKLNADPVLGAGPIVLTAVDITALIIYFSISGGLLSLID
jgi:magnesium transporter